MREQIRRADGRSKASMRKDMNEMRRKKIDSRMSCGQRV